MAVTGSRIHLPTMEQHGMLWAWQAGMRQKPGYINFFYYCNTFGSGWDRSLDGNISSTATATLRPVEINQPSVASALEIFFNPLIPSDIEQIVTVQRPAEAELEATWPEANQ